MIRPLRTMTVKELIESLEDMEPNSQVMFVCDYGDITHTPQALAISEVEEYTEGNLKESAYSDSGVMLDTEAEESGEQVVVLGGRGLRR